MAASVAFRPTDSRLFSRPASATFRQPVEPLVVGQTTVECAQTGDDLTRYLLTDDAQRAEFWQVHALACCRRALARPMSDREYGDMLNALSGQS